MIDPTLLYRADPDADGMLYRAGGAITGVVVERAASPLGVAPAVPDVVQLAGYAVRWRESATLPDGITESFPGPDPIVQLRHGGNPLAPPLTLGHGQGWGGPVLAERTAECRADPLGLWVRWTVERRSVTPEVWTWLNRDEQRGLSLGWLTLRPPVVHRSALGRVHLNPTDIQITHVAVVPPDHRPAYRGAHTLRPSA